MTDYALIVSSKDRERGVPYDFEISPFNAVGNQHAFYVTLISAHIPNTPLTVREWVNDRWFCSIGGVDKTFTASIPEGRYTATTYASALKVYLDAITGVANTVSYSALTEKMQITFGAFAGGNLTFSALNRYSVTNRKRGPTERAFQLAGLAKVRVGSATANAQTLLDLTITPSTVLYGANTVKLNGSNYVDVMTNMKSNSFTTGTAGTNCLARITLDSGEQANVQDWTADNEVASAHVLGADFKPRFYLIDEWGDFFQISDDHDVEYTFKLTQ